MSLKKNLSLQLGNYVHFDLIGRDSTILKNYSEVYWFKIDHYTYYGQPYNGGWGGGGYITLNTYNKFLDLSSSSQMLQLGHLTLFYKLPKIQTNKIISIQYLLLSFSPVVAVCTEKIWGLHFPSSSVPVVIAYDCSTLSVWIEY